jgi:DNA-binding transcriptional MerR regulator
MTSFTNRTYRTTAFAALAGVTPRALRHYDRLGLLRPKRSSAGYRIYSERDLEALEEIVALKFIGVPLKEIAAIRRRAKGPFAQVLHAQRAALEARRRTLTRAIDAIADAEASLRSGAALDASLFRRIIEVMHMDTQHEDTIAAYTAILKARVSHVTGMPAEQRATLKREWATLFEEVKAALHEDPGGPRAQALLDRWIALLQSLTGSDPSTTPPAASPEIREELWARRADWLPAGAAQEAGDLTADEALARLRRQIEPFGGDDVLEFIRRARVARDNQP